MTIIKNSRESVPDCNSLENNYYIRSGFAQERWINPMREEAEQYLSKGILNSELDAGYDLFMENGNWAYSQSDLLWHLIENEINRSIWDGKNCRYIIQATYQNDKMNIVAKEMIPWNYLPNHLTVIEEEAFMETVMTWVWCPDGLETIEDHAFYQCKYLEGIRIPESVVRMLDNAFSESGLDVIYGSGDSYAKIYGEQHGILFHETD